MSSQHPILQVLRGHSSVSLADSSRFSFSLANNGPFNTPVIPSVYITSPEEEGNVTWCAIDGDAAFSLDVPLPDIALLERTIEGLRKATASAASRTPMFLRSRKRESVVLQTSVHNQSEDNILTGRRGSQNLKYQTSRQQRVVFADMNRRIYRENFPERPLSPMRIPSPPPTAPKRGSLKMRANKVLQVLKPRRSTISPPASVPTSPSKNRPATPASLHASDGRFGSRRLRRGVSLIFKRSDSAPQSPIEKISADPLGIYTLPRQPDQVLPSPPPTPTTPQHVTLARRPLTPPLTPTSSDKPLPPLPAHDVTSDAAYPMLRSHRSNPALSPPKQPKRRFSLTDLRQKWMQPSRTDSSTSIADDSTESSGSSAVASSVDQDDPRPIPRSLGRRMKIESMHFPDLDLHFDEASF